MGFGQTASEQALLERIMRFGGLTSPGEAAVALKATLSVLGARLQDEHRARLANALPSHLGSVLRRGKHRGAFDRDEFFQRVRSREGVTLGFAREHSQAVCRAIGEMLPDDVHRLLDDALPESLRELFRPPVERTSPCEPQRSQTGTHHTLATGKPGSLHPLSESAPPGAHRHSVAESNPHGDTKISSALGTTQERLEESLATSHPNTRRTIAEGHD